MREMEKMEDMTEEAVMEKECSKEFEILNENKFFKETTEEKESIKKGTCRRKRSS